MKKALITAIVVSLSLSHSFGQVSYGIKAGLNLSNSKNIGSADNTTRLAFNGGILAEIGLSKLFFIQPEILYSIKGFKFPATAFNSNGTLSFNYISVPLLAGFRPNEKFKILLGPEFNFLTSAVSKFDNSNHDVSKNFRKFDLAIDLGAAYNIRNGFGIELRYCHGFEDLADVFLTDPLGNDIGKDRIGSNRVFQLGLFYKFFKN